MALSGSILKVLERLPGNLSNRIKPELMQCYVEINTDVCETAGQAEAQLRERICALESITDELGLRLCWTGTHPFSIWQDQLPTPDERYERLLGLLQDSGRRLVTFGLHVHVGVESGDKAVMICDRILRHLPTLLAISCNSPWWNNRITGMQSQRSKVMDGLPTAGLPAIMRNWSEYVWLLNHLLETGFISSIRDLWWDVRPHHNFGTVEVRSCDMPGNLEDTMALVSLIHCLVVALSDTIDGGTYQQDCHPTIVQQNKWRAARFGLDAELVDSFTLESGKAREKALDLVRLLRPTAERLGCVTHLERIERIAAGPTWAERQLKIFHETGDPAEVVRRMSTQSRLSRPSEAVLPSG
jgi:carboxylate-amine ligase